MPALLLTTSLARPVKKTNFAFTPRNKIAITIREDRKGVGSGVSSFSLSARKINYNHKCKLVADGMHSNTSTTQEFHW